MNKHSRGGNGVFSGHVSLDNNGGFSSVRHQFSTLNVSDYNKFVIRIKGDGKNYQFRVKSKLNEYHSYKHEFSTNKSWQIIEIPFDELKATFRGRLLDMDSFSNTILEEIGFLISNKKEVCPGCGCLCPCDCTDCEECSTCKDH